ncbi:MAG TPA: hypothetical protein VGG41_09290 [Solirubrobacteraceae bacterium]
MSSARADEALSWSSPAVIDPPDPYGATTAIHNLACPSAALCVAVDDYGNVMTSTDPLEGPSTWTLAHVSYGDYGSLMGLACPSDRMCVAVASDGDVVTSTDPTGGPTAWTNTQIPGAHQFVGVSCASTTLCVAVDNVGDVAVSTDPLGGAGTWQVTDVGPGDTPGDITCTDTPSVLCVAPYSGDLLISTDPTGGASAWSTVVLGASGPTNVSCPSSTLCLGGAPHEISAADQSGTMMVSTDPTGGAAAWTPEYVDPKNGLGTVFCDSTSLCFATDRSGDLLTSTDPAGGPSTWTIADDVDPDGRFTGVTCPATAMCIATDSNGNVLVGSVPEELDVTVVPATEGTVNGEGIACSGVCQASYPQGSTVTLTATPTAGTQFTGWSGGGCSGTGTCTVAMSALTSVTANFASTVVAPALTPDLPPLPTASVMPPTATVASPAASELSPPNTRLLGVKVKPRRGVAAFRSAATEADSAFACKLVRQTSRKDRNASAPPYLPRSPDKTYKHLRAGAYTFYVRAEGPGGPDPTPATHSFRITR